MRHLFVLAIVAAAIPATGALAQGTATNAPAGAIGSTIGTSIGSSVGTGIYSTPSGGGARVTPGRGSDDRNDDAAAVGSNRSIINGTAGSLGTAANRTTGNTLPGASALERAGQPVGTPLGGGVVTTAPATAPSSDPRVIPN